MSSFTLHAGDHQGMLAGTRLDEVADLTIKGIEFKPGTVSTLQGTDELPMDATNAKAASELKSGQTLKAVATLRDGRTVDLVATIDASRPSVTLIGKMVEAGGNDDSSVANSNIQLSDQNELPQNAMLLFSLKAETPPRFSRDEKIEVATDDGSYSTTLTLASGLTLQDSHTALATLDPAKAFGASGFGPLQFRVVTENGVKGDWQPLATLVRLPSFQMLQCGPSPDASCKLTGANLFLVDSISQDQQFTHSVQVPDGFPGRVLPVPHPGDDGQLFVKLRDDPSVVNLVTLTPHITEGKKSAKQKAETQTPDKSRPDYVSPSDSSAPAASAPSPGNSPAGSVSSSVPSSQTSAPSTSAPPSQL